MYMSKASHPAVHEHQRPPICAEEAAGFHKRVKMIHDPVKIVVPCAVFEVEFPIPPDKGAHMSSYVEMLENHQHVEASQRGLRFRDEVDKGPTEAASIDTDRIPSNDINKTVSIDATTYPSIETGRISEQKEFDVCEHFFNGETTTRSDKTGGKKRRNWKKRKRTKGGSQLSLIRHFSDGVRKSIVHSRCFSQPFAKLRALLIPSTDETMSLSFDITSATSIDCHFIVSIDTDISEQVEFEHDLVATTFKACFIRIPTKKNSNRTWWRHSSRFRYVLEKYGDFGAFWGEELHRRVRCLAMDGDLTTHPVAEVMPILLTSGQSASREETVEEMKDCRGDEGLSIDETALVLIDGDARIWAEHIL
ncbi:hypothetical protein F2Q69_00029531 [Brassica cretica]|uniref:Uncharacterized protein n=1 Tax=Brassica cretica TaxID=69181 RepID=A0A8S9S9E0_BRACR|nr:hypothetical protein F2Q69_00029531 [Brassica cretica]